MEGNVGSVPVCKMSYGLTNGVVASGTVLLSPPPPVLSIYIYVPTAFIRLHLNENRSRRCYC